jgi:hypothetical protein
MSGSSSTTSTVPGIAALSCTGLKIDRGFRKLFGPCTPADQTRALSWTSLPHDPEGSTTMGRLTTTFTSAAAAGLTALVVTVVAPAAGGDSPRAGKESATVERHEGHSTPQELQACLQDHGATGVPGEERGGRALKEWIVEHQDDESVRSALKACDVYFDEGKPGQGEPAGKADCGPAPGEKSKRDGAATRVTPAT